MHCYLYRFSIFFLNPKWQRGPSPLSNQNQSKQTSHRAQVQKYAEQVNKCCHYKPLALTKASYICIQPDTPFKHQVSGRYEDKANRLQTQHCFLHCSSLRIHVIVVIWAGVINGPYMMLGGAGWWLNCIICMVIEYGI